MCGAKVRTKLSVIKNARWLNSSLTGGWIGWNAPAASPRSAATTMPTLGRLVAFTCAARCSAMVPIFKAGQGASWKKMKGRFGAFHWCRHASIIAGKQRENDFCPQLDSPWYQYQPDIRSDSSGAIMLFQSVLWIEGGPAASSILGCLSGVYNPGS